MATKDIPDKAVVIAANAFQTGESGDDAGVEYLHRMYPHEAEKVCYRAFERAERRGLIEYGVSLRTAWLTDKGRWLLRG